MLFVLLLLLLLLLFPALSAGERSLAFILVSEPVPHITFYTGHKLISHEARLKFGDKGLQHIPWLPSAKGGNSLLYINGYAQKSGLPDIVSLSPHRTNPLWPRWRGAWTTNTTLLLANTAEHEKLLSAAPPNALRLKCDPKSVDVFCRVTTPVVGKIGSNIGNYTLIIDPERRRGQMPAKLFMYLTDGRDIVDPMGFHRENYLAAVESSDWLHIYLDGKEILEITTDHVDPYFELSSVSDTIVIGGAFWRSEYTTVGMDGLSGEVIAFQTGSVHDALLYIGAITAFLTIIVVYGRWTTGPDILTVSASLVQTYFPGSARYRHQWPYDFRSVIGASLLTPAYVASITVAWLAWKQIGEALPPSSLLGPRCDILLITLTVYATIQYILATISHVIYDLHQQDINGLSLHYVRISIAWLRHLVHGTAGTSCSVLAFIPFALSGGVSGDRIFLLVLLVPILFTLAQHAYYGTSLLSLEISKALKRRKTMRTWPRLSVLLLLLAIAEMLLLFGFAAAVAWFFIAPLAYATSALFGVAHNFLGAIFLVAASISTGMLICVVEQTMTLKKMQQIVQAKTTTPAEASNK